MKQRPIIFSAPMVRALLDGSKTQTRRIAKLTDAGHVKQVGGHRRWHPADPNAALACPYGRAAGDYPGDQLWVRESYRMASGYDKLSPLKVGELCGANGVRVHFECNRIAPQTAGKLRPAIHMPRWASRITLEITGVRLERLQKISEDDAIAEGATLSEGGPCPEPEFQSHTLGFWRLWDSINGSGSWGANPWVWAIKFNVVKP